VKLGIHVPQWGPDATREGVLAVAQAAEAAGFDSVWVADHVVIPVTSGSTYPYHDGGTPFGPEDGFLEAFTTLAMIAGATQRIRLGTSVLVLPMRDPVLTAKVAATLDALSGGRLVLGIGTGWWREEFDAVSATFEGRGARMDEQIELMRALWTGQPVAFHGSHYDLDPVCCRPVPGRAGGPPILVGGMSAVAVRRAARLGDGWHAVGASPEQIVAARQRLVELAEQAGRSAADIPVSVSTGVSRDPERTRARLTALAEAGVELAVLAVGANTTSAIVAEVEHIGKQFDLVAELG
jgi:probable F420-dependent oxidoreductase